MTQPSAYLGEATEIATKIVRDLTGRRWVWPAITTTEFVDLDPWPNVIILQRDYDLVRIGDDVVVGQHMTALVHDDP